MRRLEPDDWEVYREVRLRALRSDPGAFGSTLGREEGFDEDRWRERLSGAAVFAAMVGPDAVGLAGGLRLDDGSGSELVSMWVAPEWRGTDVAARLIGAVVDWASAAGLASLGRWVVDGNRRAERAYAKAGFGRTGRVQPVREGEPAMEFEMARPLR